MSVKVHEPVCEDSAQDLYFWFDHFLGDQLKDEWRGVGTGSAVVVDAQTGGIVRITTGATINDAYYIDWGDIRSLLVTKKVTMEVRTKLTQTANVTVYLFIRFDYDNCVFFAYASAAGANWRIRCRDGAAETAQDSGIAADTSYHIFRIECQTHGANHVHFYIDGIETDNSPITTNIPDDAADVLQPMFWIRTEENATKSVDIDYGVVRQER